ncbi:MAG TPA: proline dehydrogenase family protein, partial [Pyrinomonadaceae bacterium]|nr:proline dehydrogenase family protein [Pyrinomonadaceae bacterium]
LNSLGTGMTRFALSLGLPVEGAIKATIYKQFCGGETIAESESAIRRLSAAGVGTILDYSVEGETTQEGFDKTKEEIIRTIERAKGDPNIPFTVFKMSGIAPLGTLERLSCKKKLDAKSQAKAERIHRRVSDICEAAYAIRQPIFIDAEETWYQDAVDRLATEMMARFNQEQPIVYNTLQMYRTDRLQHLKDARRQAQNEGYIYAVKLVRGAYMEKERERAKEMGYPSPVHETKEDTDADYNAAIEYCLKHHKTMSFVAASHNEESCGLLAERMNDAGIPNDHPHIHFSQLYGMGDNISYVLGSRGYNVSKYVPYGPVHDTVPYLMRRAEENSSAAGQMSRELEMLGREILRRGI